MCQIISAKLSQIFHTLFQNPYIVVGSMTIFGALLRLYHLGYKSLWLDEAVLYWISQGNFKEVIAQNAASNSAPFLFALLINFISRLNETELILRGVPWLAGVVAIPVIYLLSKQLLPRHSAYFVAFIVTISSTQIRYSQQLREYSIAFLLALLMLTTFYNFLRDPNWKSLIVLTLMWILGIFTQYGLALLILALNIVFAVEWIFSKDRRLKYVTKWVIAQVLVLGAVAVVYQLSLMSQMRVGFGATSTSYYLQGAYWDGSSLSSLVKFAIKNTLEIISFAYPTSEYFSYSVWNLVLFVSFVGFLAALLARNWTVLAMFLFPMAFTFVAASARIYPYHGERQIIFLLPMIYVLAGYGFNYSWNIDRKKLIIFPMVIILGIGGLKSTYDYLRWPGQENIKPIVETLSSSYEPGDRIYIYYGARPAFTYYYRSNVDDWIYGISGREQPDKYLQQLDVLLSKQYRVWMVFTHCFGDECEIIQTYASKFRNTKLMTEDTGAWLYLVD